MGNPLLDPRTPIELSSANQVIDFKDKIESFGELARIIEDDLANLDAQDRPSDWRDRPVTGHLEFGFDTALASLPTVTGQLKAELDAVCQRCLKPLLLTLATDVRLAFGEESPDDSFECWELANERVQLCELVEELLIMAIPFAVKHEGSDDCQATPGRPEPQTEIQRPFADLKSQMRNKE